MHVNLRRLPNGTHAVLLDDDVRGWAKRFGRRWHLHLNGWYWRRGVANREGGATGIYAGQTRVDVISLATQVLAPTDP